MGLSGTTVLVRLSVSGQSTGFDVPFVEMIGHTLQESVLTELHSLVRVGRISVHGRPVRQPGEKEGFASVWEFDVVERQLSPKEVVG